MFYQVTHRLVINDSDHLEKKTLAAIVVRWCGMRLLKVETELKLLSLPIQNAPVTQKTTRIEEN
jgi:hypothetical protein